MPGFEDLATLFKHLGLEKQASICLIHASSLESNHVPVFSPEVDTLIYGIDSEKTVETVKNVITAVYPSDFPVRRVNTSAVVKPVEEIPLSQFAVEGKYGDIALFLKAMPEGSAFERFQEIVAHLRAPDGCPWDREQTHLSLRKHLIEESYETLDALDSGDPLKIQEELGDLLLQIVLHAQIASESGNFNINNVIRGIHDKIVRRHPHVFSDVAVDGVGSVLQNWEKIKEHERAMNGKQDKGLLDGLPASLPALVQAQEIQSRAARVGFDWPEIAGVLEKVREEIDEIRKTSNEVELAEELGDLFFALVNLSRWKAIDAESTLRSANRKFKTRFTHLENSAKRIGKKLSDLSLEEMEKFWQEAKRIDG